MRTSMRLIWCCWRYDIPNLKLLKVFLQLGEVPWAHLPQSQNRRFATNSLAPEPPETMGETTGTTIRTQKLKGTENWTSWYSDIESILVKAKIWKYACGRVKEPVKPLTPQKPEDQDVQAHFRYQNMGDLDWIVSDLRACDFCLKRDPSHSSRRAVPRAIHQRRSDHSHKKDHPWCCSRELLQRALCRDEKCYWHNSCKCGNKSGWYGSWLLSEDIYMVRCQASKASRSVLVYSANGWIQSITRSKK